MIQSLVYNYSMANVEAEAAHSGSLLRWTRQILSVRKNHPAFGLGGFKHVEADHDAVLAYLRELPDDNSAGAVAETILCAFNLSQHPVAAQLKCPAVRRTGIARCLRRPAVPRNQRGRKPDPDPWQPRLLLVADPVRGIQPVVSVHASNSDPLD